MLFSTKHIFRALLFACLLICASAGAGFSAAPSAPSKNIILISWDGAQRDHFMSLLKEGKLPSISALTKNGKLIPMFVSTHQTETTPGHAQMLSGYKPDVSGVYNNSKYDAIPEGLSVFERLENGFGDDNIVTIMLPSKSHHLGSLPAGEYADKPGGKIEFHPAEPFLNAHKNMDLWAGDVARTADETTALAEEFLQKYSSQRFFFFIHFSDPDSNGHKFGENSEQYSGGIITCDEKLGKIMAKLKALGIDDDTLIYVTADHGFDEGQKSHSIARYFFFATNDSGITAKSGDQMDVVPTILKREGLDLSALTPPLPGKPLF